MAEDVTRRASLTARAWPRRARRLPWLRHDTVASAAALAALFSATACTTGESPSLATTTSLATTPTTPTAPTPTAPIPTAPTPTMAAAPATQTTATTRAPTATSPPTTRPAVRSTTTTTAPPPMGPFCTTNPDGSTVCAMPGRPLRRWRGGWRPAAPPLLPLVPDGAVADDEARAEYASAAAFGELSLRLLALGAPAGLVAACHAAALDEIRHASLCDDLGGRPPTTFGAIPGLLGRRLGGRRRSTRVQLRRLAVESFVDGWCNEGRAAAELRARAERAEAPEDRARLTSMADDEQRHADLARAIVTWCFDQDPRGVGRALAAVTPVSRAA